MPTNQSTSSPDGNSKTIRLSPLTAYEGLTKDNSYIKVLDDAIEHNRIANIALSGTFGSGKSSIIASYQKLYNRSFPVISLATFGDRKGDKVTTTQIEQAILQQLLYREKTEALPNSRFSRITVPKGTWQNSVLTLAFSIAMAFTLFPDIFAAYQDMFGSSTFIKFLSLPNPMNHMFVHAFAIFGLIAFLEKIYKSAANYSLRTISTTGFEVAKKSDQSDQLSTFLNMHLDEIIYYFQSTEHKVIVFEDLDRFEKPEIFHKLREINKIVNDNLRDDLPVKFIYAIKDDVFLGSERTKFFDLIIPVLPRVNTSNASAFFMNELEAMGMKDSIDNALIKLASYHLDDTRTIINIVNEFTIYVSQLNIKPSGHSNVLALMIYKNIYPKDFEMLHYRKGKLYNVCASRGLFEEKVIKKFNTKIEDHEATIAASNKEEIGSIDDLIKLYIGAICVKKGQAPNGIFGFRLNDRSVLPLERLSEVDIFEKVISQSPLITTYSASYNHISAPEINFSELEEELGDIGYFERKKRIENKSGKKRAEAEKNIRSLKTQIREVRLLQFKYLLSDDTEYLKKLLSEDFTKIKHQTSESYALLESLLLEGYLGENYNNHITYFQPGNLNRVEYDFLKSIRNGEQVQMDAKLTNLDALCDEMLETDFSQQYVLNIDLIDYLTADEQIGSTRTENAIKYIANNFISSDEFLTRYYLEGKKQKTLIDLLIVHWDLYSDEIFNSSSSLDHITQIIKFAKNDTILTKLNQKGEMTSALNRVAIQLEGQLEEVEKRFDLYRDLGLLFDSLTQLSEYKELFEYVISKNLFRISEANIETILTQNQDDHELISASLKSANFTYITNSGPDTLKANINDKITKYVTNVILKTEGNVDESPASITTLINHADLSYELRTRVIDKQVHVFNSFENIPTDMMGHLLQSEKVNLDWVNFADYFDSEHFDKELATNFLNRPEILEKLKNSNIRSANLSEDVEKKIFIFIELNEELNATTYSELLSCFNWTSPNFPKGLSNDKHMILADLRKISLNEDTFGFSNGDTDLSAKLIARNFDTYLDEMEKYPIDDEVRKSLLSQDIDNERKINIIASMSSGFVIESETSIQQVANIISQSTVDLTQIDLKIIKAAISNADNSEISIQILIKVIDKLDRGEINSILAKLPDEYSKITIPRSRAKIPSTNINKELAIALKAKGLITSFKPIKDDKIQLVVARENG